MRIGFVGCGAIGSCYASYLVSKHEVCVLDTYEPVIESIKKNGILLDQCAPGIGNGETISVHPAIAFVILFLMSLTVFSTSCKWSLEKTIQHNYKSFKMSLSQEKIKFSLALVFQLQVVACSFLLKYTLEVLGIEISEISKVLLDILLLFISNYIIVIRWIARHATITPKDFDPAP